MLNGYPILLKPHFTRTILVASLRLEKKTTPFWFWISSSTATYTWQFLPHFFIILVPFSSTYFLSCVRHFYVINMYLFSLFKVLLNPSKTSSWQTYFLEAFSWTEQERMTSNDHCPPPNTRMCSNEISICEAKMCFLWPKWSDFTFICSPDVSSTYLLLVCLVNSPKNAWKGRLSIFFLFAWWWERNDSFEFLLANIFPSVAKR